MVTVYSGNPQRQGHQEEGPCDVSLTPGVIPPVRFPQHSVLGELNSSTELTGVLTNQVNIAMGEARAIFLYFLSLFSQQYSVECLLKTDGSSGLEST